MARDTSSDVIAQVVARRAMSPSEKLAQVAALNQACEQQSEAGVRARHPTASDEDVRRRVLALRVGRELMIAVYDWDPSIEGW